MKDPSSCVIVVLYQCMAALYRHVSVIKTGARRLFGRLESNRLYLNGESVALTRADFLREVKLKLRVASATQIAVEAAKVCAIAIRLACSERADLSFLADERFYVRSFICSGSRGDQNPITAPPEYAYLTRALAEYDAYRSDGHPRASVVGLSDVVQYLAAQYQV